MIDDATKTLFHPFETGLIEAPDASAQVIFYGAQPGFRLPEGFGGTLTCVQGFRSGYLALQRRKLRVVPEPEGGGYDLALVLATKHRGQNEAWIADALSRVRTGGRIVVAASKGDGGDSLRRRIAEAIGIEDHLSKYHGVAFWLTSGGARLPAPASALVEGFVTRPGMFSFDRVDPGSSLLAEVLPQDLKGEVADFCAGWGYLARQVAAQEAVTRIDLYEADHASLEAARSGLAEAPKAIDFFWQDLTCEPVARRYDAIVMNPPFHAGSKKADPGIGGAMIRAAAGALNGSGRLFLVANRPLPYETVLAARFAQSGELARNDSFKVLWGQGPRKAR